MLLSKKYFLGTLFVIGAIIGGAIIFKGPLEIIMTGWVLQETEKTVDIGEVRNLDPNWVEMHVSLPTDRRAWGIYIREGYKVDGEEVNIKVFFRNEGPSRISLNRREPDTNERTTFEIESDEEVLIYSGDLQVFFDNMTMESRFRHDEKSEYGIYLRAFLSVRPSNLEKISGNLRITSDREIEFKVPIKWYAYLPRDSV